MIFPFSFLHIAKLKGVHYITLIILRFAFSPLRNDFLKIYCLVCQECEKLRVGHDESERISRELTRENKRLQQTASDLSRQVCVGFVYLVQPAFVEKPSF